MEKEIEILRGLTVKIQAIEKTILESDWSTKIDEIISKGLLTLTENPESQEEERQ